MPRRPRLDISVHLTKSGSRHEPARPPHPVSEATPYLTTDPLTVNTSIRASASALSSGGRRLDDIGLVVGPGFACGLSPQTDGLVALVSTAPLFCTPLPGRWVDRGGPDQVTLGAALDAEWRGASQKIQSGCPGRTMRYSVHSPTDRPVRNPIRLSYLRMSSTADSFGAPHPSGGSDFNCLYEQHFPAVWAYAVTRVGRQAAEDVVSEVFAVAWRRHTSIPADALPWLLRVARNVAFEAYRSETRERLLETELRGWAARERVVEPDVAERVVNRALALTALASLSESDRELLMLVAWHGLSSRQAASVLGCSRPAFFVRLHRARSRLGRALIRPVATRVPSDSLSMLNRNEEAHP